MTTIVNHFQAVEKNINRKMERFAEHNPYISFLIMFIGAPIGVLAAVFLSTTIIMLPVSLIFGWI